MGSSKKKRSKSKQQDEIVDERFLAAANRPQFQRPKAHESKVVLDDRFASVLTDPRFRVPEKDKYGRKKKESKEAELSAFYKIEEKEGHDEERQGKSDDSESDQAGEPASDEESSKEEEDPASRIKFLTALSRGELSLSSSSDEEDEDMSASSDEEGEEEDAVHGTAGILDPSTKEEDEISLTETPSPYLAVMNMDWKHVRAVDLFAILTSFAPPGAVRRVQIYPSNFGLERMAKETQYGPTDLWKKEKNETIEEQAEEEEESDDDEEDGSNSGLENEEIDEDPLNLKQLRIENQQVDSDFDPEKLRGYEASKLKYYFAVVEFASPEHADVAYKEVDGLELEHSSAAIDLRSIPPDGLDEVVKDRKVRDEATSIPGNYEPPDFVVNALQQSSVQCTWEDGDDERHRKLTGYSSGQTGGWAALTTEDDLRAYLASDVSSDEEEVESGSEADFGGKRAEKASSIRKMLGLEGSDAEGEDGREAEAASSSEEEENDFSKQTTFIPGQPKLEDKIRSKLQSKNDDEELTPWQKYQEKRKEKRRERRQATRKLRKGNLGSDAHQQADDDGMYDSDPEFGKAEFEDVDDEHAVEGDDFFLESSERESKASRKTASGKHGNVVKAQEGQSTRAPSTKEELELLLAGDNDEEEGKDYDMRGLQRMQKNKDKKLRGSRKRKETELAATVSGKDFKIDTKDSRFAAVLEGTDDRFGIDRTDPNFKETEAMKEILTEQTKRRKAKKRAKVTKEKVAPNVNATDGIVESSGAAALSSLVMSLKSKVAKKTR